MRMRQYLPQSLKTKSDLLHVLKVATLIVCIVGFVMNCSETFHKYFSGATLLLLSIQSHWTSRPLPVFMICNSTSYKNPSNSESIWNLQRYMDQTRDTGEILHNISIYSPTNSKPSYKIEPAKYYTSELNTAYQGRCLFIELNETKVRNIDSRLLKDILIYTTVLVAVGWRSTPGGCKQHQQAEVLHYVSRR